MEPEELDPCDSV